MVPTAMEASLEWKKFHFIFPWSLSALIAEGCAACAAFDHYIPWSNAINRLALTTVTFEHK
jgi:hypothetical protein